MTLEVIVPRSLRVGEIFAVLLGLGLSTITISARIYVKSRIFRKFLSEDYFSIAAYASLLAYLGLAIVIGKNSGTAEHKAYLSMVESAFYDPAIVLVKISILLQYVTVFVVHRKSFFHYLIHVIIWGNVIFYVVVTFYFLFRCKPRRKLWLPKTPGVCHGNDRGIQSGAGNVVTDFLILILPLPTLLRLQMPLEKKLRTLSVFGFGLFACIASLVRFVYSFNVNRDKDPVTYQLNIDRQGLLAFAEIAIGIIVGCMPTTHKCYRHLSKNAPNLKISFLHSSSSGGGRYWRKLFGRSSSSSSDSDRARKKSPASTDSESSAPHITTLDMTRASFTLEDSSMPIPTPVSVPPTAATTQQQSEESRTLRRQEGIGGAPRPDPAENRQEILRSKDTFFDDDDAVGSDRVEDVERGLSPIPVPINAWQQGVDFDSHTNRDGDGAVNPANRDENETMRAQHEFGSR